MSFLRRLAVLVAAGLLLAAILAPLVKAVEDARRAAGPPLDAGYDFGRIFRRLLQVSIIGALLAGRRWLWPQGMPRPRGLDAPRAPAVWFARGLAAGCCSFILFLAVQVAAGRLEFTPRSIDAWPVGILTALAAGVIVGGLEELIFRGWLMESLRRESLVLAVACSSLVYSYAHFVASPVRVKSGWDPMVGCRALWLQLCAPARWDLLPPFLAVAALGVVLACAYEWPASLPFAIGLHAGWVAVLKAAPLATQGAGVRWLYGAGGALTGAWGWLFLGAMLAGLWLALGRGAAGRALSSAGRRS